ncbi:hypothetical protein ACEPAH_7029 [Sanghuangporus vaninii]
MGNCVTDWVFRRQRFCCCLPARFGAAVLALLTLLVSGLLAVILWFEVATNYFMSNKEKTAFILAAVLETFLCIASTLGFIGTCAKKQSFVLIFAVFLYIHFFINFGVAAYFLWMITHTANVDIVKLCEEGIRNPQGQDQCKGLLNITKGVYWAISVIVLAIEAYCTLVVTRYVNQLRYEKRDARQSRIMARQSAYDAFHRRFSSVDGLGVSEAHSKHYSALSSTTEDLEADKEGLLNVPRVEPFDPYATYDPHRRSYSPTSTLVSARMERRERSIGSDEDASIERHRNEAERQLTSASITTGADTRARPVAQVSSEERERSRSSDILALPPGAAPAIPPTSRSRESSVVPRALSPPPVYRS